jgi:hypothetical protein
MGGEAVSKGVGASFFWDSSCLNSILDRSLDYTFVDMMAFFNLLVGNI